MEDIRFIIITGMSGAGKTEAIRCFEDYGYFCVDNLPPTLIPKFAELCAQSEGKVNKIALVSDIRGGGFFDTLFEALTDLERVGLQYTILFLEASDEVLVRRFKETRRRHPLASDGGVLEGIRAERKRLEELRGRADIIIDTSNLSPRHLKEEIEDLILKRHGEDRLNVTVVSFGFKHGLPIDSDLVFDVRFLPNPHYVQSLKHLTGNDSQVIDYVLKWPAATKFIEKLFDMMEFLMPYYVKEGKAHLMVAIGCTGGQHRSVVLANKLGEFLKEKGYRVRVEHRDIES